MSARVVEHAGHTWRIREVDGQFAFEVAGLPEVWIDAPWPLEVMSDRELIELVRSELEPRGSNGEEAVTD